MEHVLTHNDMELLFEERIRLTDFVEYGFKMEDLVSGSKPIPQAGAHFDILFEGDLTGDKIKGKIKGVDYLEVRSDQRFFLNLHACITTDDGASIKVVETGTNALGDLKLFMSFYTSDERYTWLNSKQVLGIGDADFSTGLVSVKGFLI